MGVLPKPLSIFLTLQTVLKLMMLSTDGEEGENSTGKKKKKKKKKKGCKQFFLSAAKDLCTDAVLSGQIKFAFTCFRIETESSHHSVSVL